jgi:hypothetical protein
MSGSSCDLLLCSERTPSAQVRSLGWPSQIVIREFSCNAESGQVQIRRHGTAGRASVDSPLPGRSPFVVRSSERPRNALSNVCRGPGAVAPAQVAPLPTEELAALKRSIAELGAFP